MENNKEYLTFTGNWFIDAGILGFVNLMEEVYEWDLSELKSIISSDSERLFYWLFPIGYLFYHSIIRHVYKRIQEVRRKIFGENGLEQKIREIEKKIENINNEIENVQNEMIRSNSLREKRSLERDLLKLENKKRKLREELQKKRKEKEMMLGEIERMKKELMKEKRGFKEMVINIRNFPDLESPEIEEFLRKLLPDFELNIPAIDRNFFIFNSKKVKKDPFLAFGYLHLLCLEDHDKLYEFIRKKMPKSKKAKEGLTYETHPDSTVNPFLYSASEFPNVGYTKPLRVEEIKKSLRLSLPLFIPLLCFEHAFEVYYENNIRRNIFLYVNNLDVCYSINKRMRIKKEIELTKSKQQSLLRIVVDSVIDELVENRAIFSIESMYLIEYENVEEQRLVNVEYIRIPKLQASILLDDAIRHNLNFTIQFKDGKFKKNFWILEEFIKCKPLYPIILDHVNSVLNGETRLKWKPSLYSLIVDAKILELRKEKEVNKGNSLFFNDYFDALKSFRSLTSEIRKEVGYSSFVASIFSQISEDIDKKKSIARELYNALKRRNKNVFLNILLRNLNENKKLCSNKNLNEWIFKKVIKNNINYEIYGLILVMSLIREE